MAWKRYKRYRRYFPKRRGVYRRYSNRYRNLRGSARPNWGAVYRRTANRQAIYSGTSAINRGIWNAGLAGLSYIANRYRPNIVGGRR